MEPFRSIFGHQRRAELQGTLLQHPAVGILLCALELALLPLLIELVHLPKFVAFFLVQPLATYVGFLVNRSWCYRQSQGKFVLRYEKQFAVAIGSWVLNTALSVLLTSIGLHYELAFVCSQTIVYLGWNYPGNRWYVYAPPAGRG